MNTRAKQPSHAPNSWDRDRLAGGWSDTAVATFLESAGEYEDDFCGGPYAPEVYFEPMFRYWLIEDCGFRVTHGEAAQRIMDIVIREPKELWHRLQPPRPRHVLGIFGPDSKDWNNCLNPRNFERFKFKFIMKHAASGNPFW